MRGKFTDSISVAASQTCYPRISQGPRKQNHVILNHLILNDAAVPGFWLIGLINFFTNRSKSKERHRYGHSGRGSSGVGVSLLRYNSNDACSAAKRKSGEGKRCSSRDLPARTPTVLECMPVRLRKISDRTRKCSDERMAGQF